MVDPTLSFDLPPFLTPKPGLNSGLMIAEVTTAALMSENKHLATPRDRQHPDLRQPGGPCQHGRPRRAAAGRMVKNLNVILGVEAMCAAQGVEFRAPLVTSAPLQAALAARLRAGCPRWPTTATSPPTSPAAARLVADGALDATACRCPPLTLLPNILWGSGGRSAPGVSTSDRARHDEPPPQPARHLPADRPREDRQNLGTARRRCGC
jgi:histidine ammonia-lyase